MAALSVLPPVYCVFRVAHVSRTNFNSSQLLRLLTDLATMDAAESGGAFAEKLGLWLDFTDAIALFSAHSHRVQPPRSSGQVVEYERLNEEYGRMRQSLVQAIQRSCSPELTGGRIKLPRPPADVASDIAADYEPYRRFYLAHQREMETNVSALRATVRDVMAHASAPLQQLAALDGTFDTILAARESKLLASVPTLLAKRFERLRAAHAQQLANTQQADDRAAWLQPGGWLARFCQDMQTVLLAELELRVQPVLGLLEAMEKRGNSVSNDVVGSAND